LRQVGRRSDPLGATFWWLWFGALLSAFANFVAPFLTVYLTLRGLSPARTGLVASCFSAGALLGLALAGILTDRLGRRGTLLGSLAVSAASAASMAFVRAPLAMAAVVLAFGAGTLASRAPIRAIVGDLVRPDQLHRAFGLHYWAENVGSTASFLAGGLLGAYGWGLPFVLDGATTLMFALVVLARVPETRPEPEANDASGAGYAVVARDRACVLLLGLFVLFNLAYTQAMVTLPLEMASLGFTPGAIGAVLAVSAGLVTVVQPWTPGLLRRFDSGSVLAVGAVLTGAGLGVQALCTSPLQFALASCVWTLGEIAFFGTANAAVTALAPPSARGRYSAATGLCFTGSRFVATASGAAVLQEFGGGVLWSGCLVICAAAAGGLLAWRRRLRGTRPGLSPGQGENRTESLTPSLSSRADSAVPPSRGRRPRRP
jgi:MFS family permease